MTNGQTPRQDEITNEDLDKFFAVGSDALQGVKLIPESGDAPIWNSLPPKLRNEFTKGNVLKTDYSVMEKKVNAGVALACLLLKTAAK
jgi:hypothetical protein